METEEELAVRIDTMFQHLDERGRRLYAASEATRIGYGGISIVSRICRLSRVTITKGIKELSEPTLPHGRTRHKGGGRKQLTQKDPKVKIELERLVEDTTRGDPETPLRWTCKSTRALAEELKKQDHPVSHVKVAHLLHDMDYSLQGNRKTEEGDDHPDRDAQFRYINRRVKTFLKRNTPVISVDTKKKEVLGNFDNKGRQWQKSKSARQVNGHDFPSPELNRAFPYGIYDLGRNTGFVNVGTDHDAGRFAVASIRGWWIHEGSKLYPKCNELLITADGGGSNGYRLRLWKLELQKFADQTGLCVTVCHFPPGTSKWNKVEHRLFSFISSNWRGEPLRYYETVVQLIAHTTTAKGLTVTCRLDRHKYPRGIKVSKEEWACIKLRRHSFHGEWNYTIKPHDKTPTC